MPSPLTGDAGIPMVTPGEFMLQAAEVSKGFADSLARGLQIGLGAAQNKQQMGLEQQKIDMLKVKQAQEIAGMQAFDQWKTNIDPQAEPVEQLKALKTLPASVWTSEQARSALSGWMNLVTAQSNLQQKVDEISGITEQRKQRGRLMEFGASPEAIEAGPGNTQYDAAARLSALSDAKVVRGKLMLPEAQIDYNSLPLKANGMLNISEYEAQLSPQSPAMQAKFEPTDVTTAKELSRLTALIPTLPEGSPERKQAESQLANIRALTAKPRTRFQTAAGDVFESGVMDGSEPPTTGTLGALQKKINENRINVSELTALGNSIKPGDVGVPGKLAELFLDRIGPMVGLKTADLGRMERRTALKMTFEGMKRDISDDTRFSIADLRDLKKIGISDEWFNSSTNVATASRIIAEYMAKRNIMNLQAANSSLAWKDLGNDMEVWAAMTRGIGPDGRPWPYETNEDRRKLHQAYNAFPKKSN